MTSFIPVIIEPEDRVGLFELSNVQEKQVKQLQNEISESDLRQELVDWFWRGVQPILLGGEQPPPPPPQQQQEPSQEPTLAEGQLDGCSWMDARHTAEEAALVVATAAGDGAPPASAVEQEETVKHLAGLGAAVDWRSRWKLATAGLEEELGEVDIEALAALLGSDVSLSKLKRWLQGVAMRGCRAGVQGVSCQTFDDITERIIAVGPSYVRRAGMSATDAPGQKAPNSEQAMQRVDAMEIDLDNWRSSQAKSGFKGVYQNHNGTFMARIWDQGRNRTIGHYKTAEAAAKVVAQEHIKLQRMRANTCTKTFKSRNRFEEHSCVPVQAKVELDDRQLSTPDFYSSDKPQPFNPDGAQGASASRIAPAKPDDPEELQELTAVAVFNGPDTYDALVTATRGTAFLFLLSQGGHNHSSPSGTLLSGGSKQYKWKF